jgi:hypothetical protein
VTAVSVSPGRQQAGNVALVVGYAVAIWALSRAVPMFGQRRTGRFLAAEAGTAAVATGWALRRQAVPAALNGGFVAAFAAAWWIAGRRHS